MAGNRIQNTFEVAETITREDIHYIPAKIEANGPVNVDTKFSNRISKGEDGALEVHLRGRPLNGSKIQLPPNFHGFVGTTETNVRKDSETKDGPKKYRIVSDFTEYTYWNWDKKPTRNDSHVKLLDWLNVSEILHAPIPPPEDTGNP